MTSALPDDRYETWAGLTPLGEQADWRLRSVVPIASPGSLLLADQVELSDGRKVERKRLPGDVRGQDDWTLAGTQLDNEIRTLVRLATRYPNNYPAELPQLIGYNFDAIEPFVLMKSLLGATMVGQSGMVTLLTEDRKRFQLGIYRAVAALHEVDLIHGAIALSSVRWSGERLQLVGFEHSAERGEIPQSRPVTVANPPRAADPAQDIRDAGLAVLEMMGRKRHLDRTGQDKLVEQLGPGLRHVFDQDPAKRPTAVDVLAALSSPVAPPDPIDVDDALKAGWDSFDREHQPPEPWPPFPSVLDLDEDVVKPPPDSPLWTKLRLLVVAIGVLAVAGVVMWMVLKS
ncbi:hypothetical protein [Actinocrispum wychmicini]|uniref:Protein kinase domain-containing protein n=1 Tax=Actinocrispum wychmicini TaxID=1213861 RepID=A0A4R2J523_9PSEU|nr:hypothetical protein [Actinocrispum wychmicini]TCO52947.1 hypothetical protein EV192_111141 [Actinocrispum wychmicini]